MSVMFQSETSLCLFTREQLMHDQLFSVSQSNSILGECCSMRTLSLQCCEFVPFNVHLGTLCTNRLSKLEMRSTCPAVVNNREAFYQNKSSLV